MKRKKLISGLLLIIFIRIVKLNIRKDMPYIIPNKNALFLIE